MIVTAQRGLHQFTLNPALLQMVATHQFPPILDQATQLIACQNPCVLE
jgi:hypothetical protein